jgi:fatty acid desaturase
MLLFQERFLLCLHYYSHVGLFKNRTLNFVVPLAVSPFFGVPSGMYFLHHVVMHHSDNNQRGFDLSSTEQYQRDNFLHFLHYWLRFLLAIWVELPYYAWTRMRYSTSALVTGAMCVFWSVLVCLYSINPCGTFWVFLLPVVVNSFLLMFGNWSQHIFINPEKPRSNYHLTYNVINDECNQRSFNDGYHIEHHLHARRHWTELPSHFAANIKTYAEQDAIVFQQLDPVKVGILVFLQKYDTLASHLVQLKEPKRSAREVEAFLRARLVPIVAK